MKKSVYELSIFNGIPEFDEKLHVGKPNIGNRDEINYHINQILNNQWLTNNGPYIQQFEKEVAKITNVKHCIAMCNGTMALENAIRALGLSGEVIVPSFTFIATASALQWQEITPIFCDIDPTTYTINPLQVESLITPKTTGIVGVHLWGRPCNIHELEKIAEKRNLKLMFDAAHAFGCSYEGEMIGKFGNLEVFSFHATKFLNTLEGGAVVTNDDILASKLRLMKNFGFTGMDRVEYVGVNGKMNEISAAIGLVGLKSMDEFISKNRENYYCYDKYLKNINGITLVHYNENEKSNFQYIVVEIDKKTTGISRDTLLKILHAENVLARRYFYPGCHRMEPYKSFFPNAGLMLPHTEETSEKMLTLPTGTSINKGDIIKICNLIKLIVGHSIEIRQKLNDTEKVQCLGLA